METSNEGFRRFLVDAASLLTFATVKKLAVLLNFSPADIDEVERDPDPSYVFVSFLKQKGLISEENISPLIDSLKSIGLHGVVEDVRKSLRRNSPQSHQEAGITQEREDDSVVNETCTQHDKNLQKFFCTTCDSKICAECAFSFHKDKICDVFRLENLSQEIQTRGHQLRKELQIVQELSVKSRNLLTEKRNVLLKVNDNIRKEICEDKQAAMEKLENCASNLLSELKKKEEAYEKQMATESDKIEQIQTTAENLEGLQNSHDSLSVLRKIVTSRKTVTNVKQELDYQQLKLKTKFDLLYRKLPHNGRFGELVPSLLIGGIMIGHKQLVHVIDGRQNGNNVLLVCFEPEGSFKEYWRHQVTLNDRKSPVVMSRTERYTHGVGHVLFAVGNMVFIVRPHLTASFYDFVELVSTLAVDSVDEGSWISNIAVYNPANALNVLEDVFFLISISGSSLLREYRVTGEVMRTIDIRDWVCSIRLVAYVDDHFAISGFGRSDIILVTGDSTVKQNGSIRPPPSSLSLLPVCLVWGGATWLSLWVGEGPQKQWKVLRYRQTGGINKVCAEGISCSDTDVPVSITRWKNQGFISFADNTVKYFRLIE